MKKLSIVWGIILTYLLMAVPAFPLSLEFDLNGDQAWDTEQTMSLNEVVRVDIWLDVDVPPDPNCYIEIYYDFLYDKDLLEVDNIWANDDSPGIGGPWDHNYTTIEKKTDGKYYLGVIVIISEVSVGDKILLHSLDLRCINAGEGEISITAGADSVYDCDYNGYNPTDSSATIYGPCGVSISPTSAEVFPGDTVQFSATEEGVCAAPNYNLAVTNGCGSIIDQSGLYTAGDAPGCTDTVTVRDTENGNIEDTATVTIQSPLTIEPENPTIGAGGKICFQGATDMCIDPIYTWSVELSGGYTGSTINAIGCYRARRDVSQPPACLETIDTVHLEADCGGDKKTAETNVTVTPCLVTISPNPSPEVETGETVLFTASGNECCANDPCYTWEVSVAGTTGNTTNNTTNTNVLAKKNNSEPTSGPIYTWSLAAAGATGNTGNTFVFQAGSTAGTVMVEVTDTCNNYSADTVTVDVISTTTTTTSIPDDGPQCTSDAYCYDGRFCNGIERCVGGKCQSGSDPCPDDGLFCNGDESCDEGEDVCTQSGDPCPPDLICNEEEDVCVECLDDADCDDNGLFCDGEETCDEENSECVGSGDPCSEPTPICDEDLDRCVGPGPACDISIEPETAEVVSMQTLSFTAQVTGEDCLDPEYVWSIETTIGSSIDQNGNYVAGINYDFSNEATDVVTVDDNANGISIEATVTVSWGCSLLQIYGENSKEVKVLRSFRDNVLSQTPEGQEIIRLYYEWSPMIVKAMEDEGFKEVVKEMMDGILPMVRTE